MAFQLSSVVPWGRTFDEYKRMFMLDENMGKIAGFGDGPASFNSEATKKGWNVTSFDPIYEYTREHLEAAIECSRKTIMQQMAENKENYVWDEIKTLDELEKRRMSAMKAFLCDYEKGKAEGRYIRHSLPAKVPFDDNSFDLGLSSHFLLMYTGLGYDFHIAAVSEMLRVCKEVRIFPILDLDSKKAELTDKVIEYFARDHKAEMLKTDYEFQKGGNKLLRIVK